MAEQLTMKSRPLGKDEVMFLLDLVSKRKVLTTKATNAESNKLKEEAWKTIAHEFSATTGEVRRPDQLRLKWENLKKSARKRNALIKQNVKTGGKAYIPRDEALDRVASMLSAACSGSTVEFGGDSEHGKEPQYVKVEVMDCELSPVVQNEHNNDVVEVIDGDNGDGSGGLVETDIKIPNKFIFKTSENALNKRRKLSEEIMRARRDKELALAHYLKLKSNKVAEEIKQIQLQNIKLQLEIDKLK